MYFKLISASNSELHRDSIALTYGFMAKRGRLTKNIPRPHSVMINFCFVVEVRRWPLLYPILLVETRLTRVGVWTLVSVYAQMSTIEFTSFSVQYSVSVLSVALSRLTHAFTGFRVRFSISGLRLLAQQAPMCDFRYSSASSRWDRGSRESGWGPLSQCTRRCLPTCWRGLVFGVRYLNCVPRYLFSSSWWSRGSRESGWEPLSQCTRRFFLFFFVVHRD